MDIFGDWFNKKLKVNNFPYNHIIIENFLSNDFYNIIIKSLPKNIDNFWKYYNPIEVKYVLDNRELYDSNINCLIDKMCEKEFVDKLKNLFNINDIEPDKTLHGSGLHYHPRYGRLNMHLDYEKHPLLENKQRRLNIIFYLNDEWNNDWNGATELWDSNMTKCITKCYPKKNRVIIFETSEFSWHGVPDKIMCPEKHFRKTLAFYYISPLTSKSQSNKLGANSSGYRTKAVFVKRPQDKYNDKMEKLYNIRPQRRITENDINEIWPEWNIKI
tara:strand:- start:1107 stop:1922 length:816 start_codon:yes stop_codon:yes gene_type:complete